MDKLCIYDYTFQQFNILGNTHIFLAGRGEDRMTDELNNNWKQS